jgi:hypothetical protein
MISDSQPALFTFDARSTLRLYTPIVDAPSYFQMVFAHRLSALDVPHDLDIRKQGEETKPSGLNRDRAYNPYTISSSGSGDEIYWVDRSHNIRSVRFEGFEAKPPSVLRIGAEKVWKLAQSSSDTVDASLATQVVAVDLDSIHVLVSETDAMNNLTHLKRVDLELGVCRASKRIFLGLGHEQKGIWRDDRLGKVLTVTDQGICGVWDAKAGSSLQLTATLNLLAETETIDALCLLEHEGPLVYSSDAQLRAVDLETGCLVWELDISKGCGVKKLLNIRRLEDRSLLLTAQQGIAMRAIFHDAITAIPKVEMFDPRPTLSGVYRPVSDKEECRIVQPAGPLVIGEQEHDDILVATNDGRLLWTHIAQTDIVIARSLRIASENMDLLAVAGRRKAACGEHGLIYRNHTALI